MKKITVLVMLLLMAFTVMGCQPNPANDSSAVVISKLYTGTNQEDNLIELYNPSDEAIDLSNHQLNFYNNGSREISSTINLEGTINSASYFIIGSDFHTQGSSLGAFDFSIADFLPYNGNDVVEIAIGETIIDSVGTKGLDLDFSRNVTLIRIGDKAEFSGNEAYVSFSFIEYVPEAYQYLGNDDYQIKTYEQMLAGPRLEERYKELPYRAPGTTPATGGGGAIKVTLVSIADGDTATFTPVDSNTGYSTGYSNRYYYIDTPEVSGPNTQPMAWGYAASKLNKEYILVNANEKELYVQSIPGNALTDTYSRNLALVWINGYLSQFITVAEGLSDGVSNTYTEADVALSYLDVPILTFLRFAEHNAINLGWGTWGYPINPTGDVAPDWDYITNRSSTANLASWAPHNPMPWE